jgi:hypothetical protein
MAQRKYLNSGFLTISSGLVSLGFFWLSVFVGEVLGGDNISKWHLIFCGAGIFVSVITAIVGLAFYIGLCLRLWRDTSSANWRLWAFGTILLLAAGSSLLFYH